MENYDFSGWATKYGIRCSDGRTIMKQSFKDNDGKKVPLVWNHVHGSPDHVLGYAILQHRDEGVYAYGKFNDTESGQLAKKLVLHGDVDSLSIYANQLKESQKNVSHGNIRELSLVLAGANIGAHIENVIEHGEESEDCAWIDVGSELYLEHGGEEEETEEIEESSIETAEEKPKDTAGEPEISHADKEEPAMAEENKSNKTIGDVLDTMTEEQKTAVMALVGLSVASNEKDEEEDDKMSHNVFESDEMNGEQYLSHSAEEEIVALAKTASVGSFKEAVHMYFEDNHLAHGIDDVEALFPEYRDVKPGAPEFIDRDEGWVSTVMNGVSKIPYTRIRTRQADITSPDLRAYGYEKGTFKHNSPNIKLLNRTTDPQTIYRKDGLNRDDILDVTDFDLVEYQYQVMKRDMNEELATAFLIGDGRDDGDPDKIHEDHVRPIWLDDELYTIHYDVDVSAMAEELQGTYTDQYFGENFVYAEALVNASLYSREKYKGSGNMSFYCTPHLLNVMLLARDRNGHRIYSSKTDLAAALNVKDIITAEQFENKTRVVTVNGSQKTKKLLGLFVNLSDYKVGSTKGGEITRFNQFDMDFNQERCLIETRISGALSRVKSAIALEEDITEEDTE